MPYGRPSHVLAAYNGLQDSSSAILPAAGQAPIAVSRGARPSFFQGASLDRCLTGGTRRTATARCRQQRRSLSHVVPKNLVTSDLLMLPSAANSFGQERKDEMTSSQAFATHAAASTSCAVDFRSRIMSRGQFHCSELEGIVKIAVSYARPRPTVIIVQRQDSTTLLFRTSM